MATIYLEKLQIPEGFEEMLHDLIKEVLREQPEDIHRFCHEYFCAKKENRKMNRVGGSNEFGVRRDQEIAREVNGKVESVAAVPADPAKTPTPKGSQAAVNTKENQPSVTNVVAKQPTIAEATQSATKMASKEKVVENITSQKDMGSQAEVPQTRQESSATIREFGSNVLKDLTNAACEEMDAD